MLRRRGVRHHDIDEIVQETAARAISTHVPYDDTDDLFRWASVVGGRLAIDLARRCARLSDDELPDRADTIDVAMAAEHRVVLGAVRNRLPELSSRDQEALLSGFHDEPVSSRRESVRVAVARHRARNRLRVLLDGLAGAAILGWARRNRLWAAPAEAISYAAIPVVACVMISVGALGGAANPPTRGAAPQPQPVAYAISTSAAPMATAPEVVHRAQEDREISPPSRPSPAPELQDPAVIVNEPDGHQTSAGLRDKEVSDHLWCLTPPPEAGQATRCVDTPVTLPSAP
jgi:DNA-directed RNA polymerase specialized sigma24 family protein